ncbi:Actin cortical patch SUR7/pH-response regulator PalI [Penicillium expansum]|uniref:Actin cortical patch SUR7/pH-response regulator PalI n=1 Tax=Penicillium expansum TaxID=27334 RepID=A0A0A2I6A9_PENEN|nr:Actin cortical patch SUR7/pH-response regulator PalI [Penicillium expansum]KGO38624.1 Actin cortical patch SUR7/pH-response regulator PalI [Penicillium expansum]KGO59472.1 Actin cortical patch SUR7/pH-response regulator PalI [Penicillium expansum]
MNGTNNGKRKLPFFKSTTPIDRQRKSSVHWHRILRSLLYLIAWIFLLLVVIGNTSNKPVLRSTYFLYLDLSNIIPVSVPNAVLINSIAQTIGLHDFYQVGLWNFCEGYNGEGITHCSKPETLYAFNPVAIILNELLSGATIALPADIESPLKLARTASHWMFGLLLSAAIFNFVLIFLAPLAVSSRHPRNIKAWAAGYSDGHPPAGNPPHRRRTFFWLRALPMLILTFFTALVTIVGSAVATVMFVIFANVFSNADPSINIQAHVGTQMLVFMWIASAFSLIAFIIQIGSCCAACCRGRKARKQLKLQGINWHEKGAVAPVAPKDHAVSSCRDDSAVHSEERRLGSSGQVLSNEHEQKLGDGHASNPHYSSTEPHAISN